MNLCINRPAHLVSTLLALSVGGCTTMGHLPAFGHQFRDNQEGDLTPILGSIAEPDASPSAPVEIVLSTHATETAARELVALSLDGSVRWRVPFDAMTRPEIVGSLVLVSDRNDVVAFDVSTGERRFSLELDGLAFVGAAAGTASHQTEDGQTQEREAVVLVTSVGAGGGAVRVGRAFCVSPEDGDAFWEHEIAGVLGRPAIRGGHVFMPWDRQNLAVLDLYEGTEEARLRTTDDIISWVQEEPTGIYYGGPTSVYRLDARSASGTKTGSTYRAAPISDLPREPSIAEDGFFPAPGTRSARSKIRVYAGVESDGYRGSRIYYVYYRYIFAFDNDGVLTWATPTQADIVAARVTEQGLFVVDEQGQFALLRGADGTPVWKANSDLAVASAGISAGSIDVPLHDASTMALPDSLLSIVADPDNRLIDGRAFAVAHLGRIDTPEVTARLLALYPERTVPPALRTSISEVIRTRTSGGELLVSALDQHYDFLAGTTPPPFELLLPAIREQRLAAALPGLLGHLASHETPATALTPLIETVELLGDAAVVDPLKQFLTRYHADSTFAEDATPLIAAAHAVITHGGEEGRAWVTQLSERPTTIAALTAGVQGIYQAERDAVLAAERAEAERVAAESAAQQANELANRPIRLTQAQINEVVGAQSEPIRQCLIAERARSASFSQLRTAFIIESAGTPDEVRFAPANRDLDECVRPVIEALRFPAIKSRRQRASFTLNLRRDGTTQTEDETAAGPWWGRAARYAVEVPLTRPWWETTANAGTATSSTEPTETDPWGGEAPTPWWLPVAE